MDALTVIRYISVFVETHSPSHSFVRHCDERETRKLRRASARSTSLQTTAWALCTASTLYASEQLRIAVELKALSSIAIVVMIDYSANSGRQLLVLGDQVVALTVVLGKRGPQANMWPTGKIHDLFTWGQPSTLHKPGCRWRNYSETPIITKGPVPLSRPGIELPDDA